MNSTLVNIVRNTIVAILAVLISVETQCASRARAMVRVCWIIITDDYIKAVDVYLYSTVPRTQNSILNALISPRFSLPRRSSSLTCEGTSNDWEGLRAQLQPCNLKYYLNWNAFPWLLLYNTMPVHKVCHWLHIKRRLMTSQWKHCLRF